jgi:hypothetical protein
MAISTTNINIPNGSGTIVGRALLQSTDGSTAFTTAVELNGAAVSPTNPLPVSINNGGTAVPVTDANVISTIGTLTALVVNTGSIAALKTTPRNPVTITQSIVTVPATTTTNATQLIPANANRKTLYFVNIGTNLATLAFNTSTITAGSGLPLMPASQAGYQGGGYSFDEGAITTDAIYGLSTSGTTIVVLEGN